MSGLKCENKAEEADGGLPGILMVGNFLPDAANYGTVGREIAKRLAETGWKVWVTSKRMARIPRLLDMMSTTWRRRAQYQVAQVDVYSGPAFFWAETVARLLRRVGRPFVLTLHGGGLPEFARAYPGRVRKLLASAAVVTSPSPFLREHLRAYREDIRVIPNAIDVAQYAFREREQPRPELLWLRAFHSCYNPTMAVHVTRRVRDRNDSARLRMVGPDKRDGSLDECLKVRTQLKLEREVDFPGPVPKSQVGAILESADILLNTTDYDNTPVSLVEAMACGLCIVTTNVGGIPFLVRHEREALLVSPRDPSAMADEVCRLLGDRELASRLSRSARREAERYDWSSVLPQWDSLLRTLGAGKTS